MTSEIRFDPLRGHRVVLSSARIERPNEYRTWCPDPSPEGQCPFCEGNEAETPPEVFARRKEGTPPDGPGWQLRVVPNRYPALKRDSAGAVLPEGLFPYECGDARGCHEVLIDTSDHDVRPFDFTEERVVSVMDAVRHRVNHHSAEGDWPYVVAFRNDGIRSGASLSHSHMQIAALPSLPATLLLEIAALRDHWKKTERCLACDLVQVEHKDGDRIVGERGEFVCYVPYAGRFPAEMIVTSRVHPTPFREIGDGDMRDLALLLLDALRRLHAVFGASSTNWVIHAVESADLPFDHHWRVEIFPRLAQVGGFELGTGSFINGIPPEESARRLREAVITVSGD